MDGASLHSSQAQSYSAGDLFRLASVLSADLGKALHAAALLYTLRKLRVTARVTCSALPVFYRQIADGICTMVSGLFWEK